MKKLYAEPIIEIIDINDNNIFTITQSYDCLFGDIWAGDTDSELKF